MAGEMNIFVKSSKSSNSEFHRSAVTILTVLTMRFSCSICRMSAFARNRDRLPREISWSIFRSLDSTTTNFLLSPTSSSVLSHRGKTIIVNHNPARIPLSPRSSSFSYVITNRKISRMTCARVLSPSSLLILLSTPIKSGDAQDITRSYISIFFSVVL